MRAWKKMEKVFETQEELTGYLTGRVKGGFICTVTLFQHSCLQVKLMSNQ